jgi:glycosyltransferase involved in cell wall biosynthesis
VIPPEPPLRVALLNPAFWPEVRRGAERVVRELADGLLERGHAPQLITSHRGPTRTEIEDGLPITRVRRPPDGLLLKRGFQEHLTHVPLAVARLLDVDVDIAHAHYATEVVGAAHWARRTGRPLVFSYHGLPQRKVLAARRLRLRTIQSALARSQRIVVSSEAAAAAMERWFGVQATAIHPGVRLDAFTPDPGERAEQPTIVCAAAVDDQRKRVPMLLRAFDQVRRRRPGTQLVLLRPVSESLARELASISGVSLIDPVARPADLAPIYRRAWVSALSAYDEAFGLVLAEALACGTPVVGTDDGGIPEITGRDDSVGRLFGVDDEAALVGALLDALELAEDPATAARCRARAERFSSARFVDRHVALYRELGTGAGAG